MTSLISDDAQIGLMGSESSIYVYAQGASDYAVNFAQLTQRAGNFLVSRTAEDDFSWENLRGKTILGGRAGGMPQMLLEYILEKNGLTKEDVNIIQNVDFGLNCRGIFVRHCRLYRGFEPSATLLEQESAGFVVASLGVESGYVPYTAYCAKKSFLSKTLM